VPSTKSVDSSGRATVEFRLPPEAGASQAWLAGEFNDWSVETHPLAQGADGSLVTTVELDPGSYRYRYYLGNGEWENDWAADAYVDNEHGGQDSLIVIPPAQEAPPPAAMGDTPQRAEEPVKKAAAKKKAPAKKAATKKAAAKKKASPSE
jgi:1,4-alpha-glucan branching enzyme